MLSFHWLSDRLAKLSVYINKFEFEFRLCVLRLVCSLRTNSLDSGICRPLTPQPDEWSCLAWSFWLYLNANKFTQNLKVTSRIYSLVAYFQWYLHNPSSFTLHDMILIWHRMAVRFGEKKISNCTFSVKNYDCYLKC